MKRLILSNSMWRSLNTCSTQAWLRTNGYAADEQEEAFFVAGRAAHLAFELWIQGKHVHDCVQAFLDAYQMHSEKYVMENDRLHHTNLKRILEVFFTSNPIVSMPFEVVATEQQVVMPIFTWEGVEYCVSDKSDAIVRMLDTGDLYAFENKTTMRIDDHSYDEYDLDSQISCHVAASRYSGWDVKGCFMQLLQFGKLPDPNAVTPKRREPAKCRTTGHGLVRDCWTQHVQQVRFPVTRTMKELETWKDNVYQALLKYDDVLSKDLWCVAQEGLAGKCGRCEFRAFCKGDRRFIDERLVKRQREEGVVYSGYYEGEEN